MFLFPVGLKSRIMRVPLATVALLLAMVAFSVTGFQKKAAYKQGVLLRANESGVWRARKDFVQSFCASGGFTEQQCQYVSTHLQPQDFGDLKTFFNGYKTQFPEDSGADFKKWAAWLSNENAYKSVSNEMKTIVAYTTYETALKSYRAQVIELSRQEKMLVKGNIRIVPAVQSLFSHEGWVDFACSAVLLLLFAVFLEQRVGFFGVAAISLMGGIGGNLIQAAFLPTGAPLAGAGGMISAVLGAFLVYFAQEKSYLHLNIAFVFRRTVGFSVWLYVAVAWLASYAVCLMSGSQATHLSHAVGFALGAIIASMQKDLFPLKKTFLFPHEQKMYVQAKEATKFEDKMGLFRKIYKLNHESFYSYRILFAYFEKHKLSLTTFSKEDREFVSVLLMECLNYTRQNDKYEFSQQVLGLVPLSWDLKTLNLTVDAVDLIDRADRFQAQGFLVQGLRYYDFFLEKYAAHPRAENAHSVIMQVFDELERFESEARAEMVEVLTAYAEAHPTTHFQYQIRNLSQQVEQETYRGAG